VNDWGQLLERLTDRLSVDPELQRDVAQELRAHLEDSAESFRRAGESESEAAARAARALGDETELAEQLFQANRGRMRLRGVIRWAAQVALVPVAVAIVVALLLGVSGGHVDPLVVVHTTDFSDVPDSWTRHLTEPQRFVLFGDPATEDLTERAKSVADRWPDDPVFYGNYAAKLLSRGRLDPTDPHTDYDPDAVAEALAVAERGEKIDPDNAFYNFAKATLLIGAAGDLRQDPSRKYRHTMLNDVPYTTSTHWQYDVRERAQFDRGLAEFRRGLGRAEYALRSIDMMELRMDLLPEPDRYNDCLLRVGLEHSFWPMRSNHWPRLGCALSAHAVALAEAGKADEAVELIDSVALMALKIGRGSRTLGEMGEARMIQRLALADAVRVYELLGRESDAARARRALAEEIAFSDDLRLRARPPGIDLSRGGMLNSVVLPRLPGERLDPEPGRTAEQIVFAQLALAGLLAVLVVAALPAGAMTIISLLRRRGRDRPLLVFIGWRRIGRICLLAIVLPMTVYALYVGTGKHMAYGAVYGLGKFLLEYAVLVAAMYLLLMRLSYSAIRRRAAELGLDVPPPIKLRQRRWLIALGALVALAAGVYLAGWWTGFFEPAHYSGPFFVAGIVLACAVAAFVLLCHVRELFGGIYRRRYRAFRETFRRSLVPILAAAAILIGVTCGWTLARGERWAVRRITGNARVAETNHIERSDYRLLRERMDEQYEALIAARRRAHAPSAVIPPSSRRVRQGSEVRAGQEIDGLGRFGRGRGRQDGRFDQVDGRVDLDGARIHVGWVEARRAEDPP